MKTISDLYAHAADGGVQIHTAERVTPVFQIVDDARHLAGGLRGLGIVHGDRVAAWLPNLSEYLVLHAACARLGAILVAINTRFGAPEIADIAGRSGAKVLAVSGDVGMLGAMAPDVLPELTHIVTIGPTTGLPAWRHVAVTSYKELKGAGPLHEEHGGAGDLVDIFTTSGTTSAPKFAAHHQGGIAGHARDVARFLDLTASGSINMQLLPFCGVFGFVQVMAALAARATIIMPVSFDVRDALALGQRHRVTHMFVTDDMLHRMLEESTEARPFPDLRSCMYAGFNSFLHGLPNQAEARGIPVQGAFGMSEVFAIFAGRPMDLPSPERHRPGGTLVSAASRVRARDPESGDILEHGEVGELEVRGPFMMAEYFGNPEATKAGLTGDGYLRTGDLGYTEPNQTFTYLQRMNDTLRLGGYLVAPSEIEAVVMAHPAVRDAQVVAAGTVAGNRPVAFVIVQTDAPLDEASVIGHCQKTLPKFKSPVRVVAIDAFPVTRGANGTKIQRTKLRDMAEDLLGG